MDGKHILTTSEMHDDLIKWGKNVKKRKTIRTKKGKRGASEVEQEYIDESEASEDEQLVVLECIEVKRKG